MGSRDQGATERSAQPPLRALFEVRQERDFPGSAPPIDSASSPGQRLPGLRGSWLCGAVACEIAGVPMAMSHCHCQTCRKANGSAFAANAMVRADDLAITAGRDALWSVESSPNERRWFCSRRGSPIYSRAEVTKQAVSVRCGTLDADLDDLPQTGRGPG